MKKITALALSLIMVLGAFGFSVFAQDGESTEVFTVYLGDRGDDANPGTSHDAPVATLAKAFELIGTEREGVIKIVGDYDLKDDPKDTAERKHVTVTGYDDTSRLIYSRAWGIGGDTTFENLIWRVNKNSVYILGLGHTIEFGRGIVTEKGDNIGVYISIRGGGDTREINGDTNVILRSGIFSHIVGGTANRMVNGDTHITIYGGVFTGAIDGGNNSYLKDSPGGINGSTNIKIIGGDFSGCSRISGSDGTNNAPVLYERTLDLSEYDGTLPDGLVINMDKVIYKKEKKSFGIISGAKYITGYSDGTFKPQGNIKRSEAVAVVTRLVADEAAVKGAYASEYADVEEGAWYADYAAFLEDAGYLSHFTGNFEPDKYITRAEFVAILANLGLGSYKNIEFSDVTAEHPLYEAVRWAASNGVVTGYPDGTFRPDNTITRAEAVTVINRFIGRSAVDSGESSFSDSVSHWAKGQIEAAAFPEKAGAEITVESEMASLTTAKEYFEYAKNVDGTDKTVKAVNYAADALRESIKNTKSEHTLGEGGTTYYVSPNGDDKNDGKSPENAWKTIGRAGREDGTLKPGDVVLFERGAEYRGQKLWTKPGVTYSAYGEGAKPVFNRSPENGADDKKWNLVDGTDNIYTYSGDIPDCGTLIFDGGEKWAVKDLPNWNGTDYVVRNGSGKYDPKARLTSDLMFVQLDYTKGGGAVSDMNNYGKIYLRCDKGNPGAIFKSIEFSVRDHAIAAMRNVTIDNIRVINAGAHGVSAGNCNGLTVRNCEFEWIGGGIQGHTNGYATRFGNAVEIWGKTDDYKVYNCYFNQIYDAAMTAQYKTTSASDEDNKVALRDITFTGNVVANTKYPIEIFLGISRQDDTYAIENLLAEYNFFIDIGSGLCEQSPDDTTPAGLKSGGDKNPGKNYVFRNNALLGSRRNLFEINAAVPEWYAKLSGNIYAQKEGGGLGTYGGKQLTFYENAEELIKNTCLDDAAKVFFIK